MAPWSWFLPLCPCDQPMLAGQSMQNPVSLSIAQDYYVLGDWLHARGSALQSCRSMCYPSDALCVFCVSMMYLQICMLKAVLCNCNQHKFLTGNKNPLTSSFVCERLQPSKVPTKAATPAKFTMQAQPAVMLRNCAANVVCQYQNAVYTVLSPTVRRTTVLHEKRFSQYFRVR